MNRNVVLLLVLIFLGGCAKLAHINELLTLQDLSIEQDKQVKFVAEQNAKFDLLLQAIEDDSIARYPNKESFMEAFGTPVYSREINRDGDDLEQAVYRTAKKTAGSPRVEVLFTKAGKLVEWARIPPAGADQGK